MKHRWLLYLFGINLLAELMALYYGLEFLQYITKPLLMIILGWFVSLQPTIGKRIKTLLLFAILFSLGGDVFLLFDQNGGPNFMLGLLSFLMAHLFYIILFLHIKKSQRPQRSWNTWIIAALLLYVALLFYLLSPNLGELKIPVVIYALVLSSMLITAMHAFRFTNDTGRWVISGAFLFVISDSLLAINKFYTPFAFAGLAIMSTYALAQFLIITGVTKFTGSTDKP